MRWTKRWVRLTALAVVVGWILAVTNLPGSYLLALGLLAGFSAAVIGSLFTLGRESAVHEQVARVARWAATTSVATVAAFGWLTTIPVVGVPLLLLLATSWPPVVSRIHLFRHDAIAEEPARPDTDSIRPGPVGSPAELDDAALCRAWRTSFVQLDRAPAARHRLAVVRQRAALLDELAVRHPDGFRRWLDSGARAAGDPTRHLSYRTKEESKMTIESADESQLREAFDQVRSAMGSERTERFERLRRLEVLRPYTDDLATLAEMDKESTGFETDLRTLEEQVHHDIAQRAQPG